MLFSTQRTRAVLLTEQHAELLHRYYTQNQEHLRPWEPTRANGYHSVEAWRQRSADFEQEHYRALSLRLLALEPHSDKIVGVCFFTNIVQGVFKACNLGYSIDHKLSGQGLMTEIVGDAVEYAFAHLDLHRIMANYMPDNKGSARVLEKLGFEKEGYAKSYLKIAGEWRDHVLTAKINPEHL